ncbi:uncharacterized protein N7479_002766 [Penicillium vulpinum]|uniref:uncharacterized protein n=1 Tax=Penicillium vulpinum TaxID=29845 RepID=UPI002547AF41|nr:uncharacterized protein N7479_002766 [Penicillium vulpinum]KAJ5972848.1 hypothetical protein N7479_002766 [Penicillium vulpinum]
MQSNAPTIEIPVTRSQFKNLANQSSNSAQGNTEATNVSTTSVEQEQVDRGAFVEWLDLDYAPNSIPKQIDWKSILKDVRKIHGCRQITFTCPMENP